MSFSHTKGSRLVESILPYSRIYSKAGNLFPPPLILIPHHLLTLQRGEVLTPEWKRGLTTGETMASFSLPPAPLLAMFAIVVFFLLISQGSRYKEQFEYASMMFQLLLYLTPVFLIFLVRSSFTSWRFDFWIPQGRRDSFRLLRGFPWGVAIFMVALLVLLSYQSSFQSKWFLPFRRSN